jgi:hypothetical protein
VIGEIRTIVEGFAGGGDTNFVRKTTSGTECSSGEK